MAHTYLNLLVITCLCLIGWGVIRVERIYQYPFFMGSMFLSFVLPQAFALTDNPGPVNQVALERVLLVSCLCAASCLIGYEFKPNRKWLAQLNIIVDERKLFRGGIVLMAQGWFFNFLLSRTTPDIAANGNWTGPATIYLFLAQVGNIAFGIFLLQAWKRPNAINIICTVISASPLIDAVLKGRRQPTMTLAIIIGLSLWLVHRRIPPRWLVITGISVMAFLIPLFGALRGDFWNLVFSGNWQAVISSAQNAFAIQQKGEILELRNAALFMDVVDKTGLYGYGGGWWDGIVFQYVPGQLVGFEFKKSLQFNFREKYDELLLNLYAYRIPNGTTPTGIADSFTEYGYFGCITFAFIGYIFKNLWISAVYYKSIFSRLLYLGLISPAMIGLTHGIGAFIQQAIFQVIFLSLVVHYSKIKHPFFYNEWRNIS